MAKHLRLTQGETPRAGAPLLLWAVLVALGLGLLLHLSACAPLLPPQGKASSPEVYTALSVGPTSAPSGWDTARCDQAEGRYGLWGGLAAGAAALAGGGALTTAFPDSPGTRIGLGVGSALVGVASAVAVFERDTVAKSLVQHCGSPPDGGAPAEGPQ